MTRARRLSAPQRRLLSALVSSYPVGYATLSPLIGRGWARSLEPLVRAGLVDRVIRFTQHGNGESCEYLGYIATRAGEAAVAEGR